MPRYVFEIHNGEQLTRDEISLDFADEKTLREAAIQLLPKVALDELSDVGEWALVLNVRDGTGRQIFKATLLFSSSWATEDQQTGSDKPQGGSEGSSGYDVDGFAQRHDITTEQAGKLIEVIGDDRQKLDAAARKLKNG
jgi:hypothetical protein